MQTQIRENVLRIRETIAAAAKSAGRSPDEITLVAASKMNDTAAVRAAFEAGITVFGENRVQEMLQKHAEGAYDGAELHFIGHLQTNKAKRIVECCSLIQSVDSDELLRLISARGEALGLRRDVLIEVNIGREAAKSGVLPEELDSVLDYAETLGGVRVAGLMAIPPADADERETRNYFDLMYKLYVDTAAKKYDNVIMKILSMGMSGDYEAAIAAGATMVRVGSAIFGARNY